MIKLLTKLSSLAIFIGLIATVGNVYVKIQHERIKKEGIEAFATAKRISQYKSGYSGNLHVEFVDQNQVKQTAETNIGDVDEEILDNLKSNPVVKIKYLEESPSNILAPSYSKDPIENLLEGTGILIIGTVGLFSCRKYQQNKVSLR